MDDNRYKCTVRGSDLFPNEFHARSVKAALAYAEAMHWPRRTGTKLYVTIKDLVEEATRVDVITPGGWRNVGLRKGI